MKKTNTLIFLTAGFAGLVFAGVSATAYSAYPVYQTQQQQTSQVYQTQQQQQVYPVYTQNQAAIGRQLVQSGQYTQATGVVTPAAANPTRVTGTLPKVGSTANNAGRQYYQPENFDRLSDSGLYIGLSLGYTTSVQGQVKADYTGETKAWAVPGAFESADFNNDTVLPLQVSVGAAINNDIRVDFSYSRYNKISYPDSVRTSDGLGGYVDTIVTGGAISASATMLNLYYNIDSFTGYIAGGGLRPYIGLGVGISTNTISDYLVYDPNFYAEVAEGEASPAGKLTGISDIYAYHAGGTTEQLAYMFEGGVTTELDGGIKIDFFARYAGLGKVQSSGSIVMSQTEWLGTGVGLIGEEGAEEAAPYDSVFHYTNWYESGRLGVIDVGVRLRLQF